MEGLLRMHALEDDYNMAVGKLQNFIDVRELVAILEIVLIGGSVIPLKCELECYMLKIDLNDLSRSCMDL